MNQDMVFSMQDFLVFLTQRIWSIIISVLLAALIGLGVTYILIDPTYDVSFSFYVYNNSDRTDADSISISDLSASQELLNTYIAIMTSDSLLNDLIDDLPQYHLTTNSLKDYISTTAVNSTELLKVTVTHSDPNEALDIAQSLQSMAPDFITKVVQAGSVQVLDTATTATPTNRPFLKNTLLGGSTGLLLALLILLSLFLLDTRIWDETDLMEKFSLPVIGIIPSEATGSTFENGSVDDYLISDNMSFASSEAYRAARINILMLPIATPCKTLVITSSKPEEGKTISAINIAITLAQNNNKVLLVDMDFRKPQIQNYLHLRNNDGFLSYIMGEQDHLDIIQFDDLPLHILATNSSYPYPSEVLSSPRVIHMFEELAKNFEYIIVDTPPLEYVIDAAVLSDIVSGYLIVSRAGYSRIGQVENTVKRLEQLNANIHGFFLRNVDPRQAALGSRYHVYNYTDKYEPYYR